MCALSPPVYYFIAFEKNDPLSYTPGPAPRWSHSAQEAFLFFRTLLTPDAPQSTVRDGSRVGTRKSPESSIFQDARKATRAGLITYQNIKARRGPAPETQKERGKAGATSFFAYLRVQRLVGRRRSPMTDVPRARRDSRLELDALWWGGDSVNSQNRPW